MFSANLEHWPLDRLIPHARNARTHSEAQVAQIAGSIAEFGFVNPVLVGDDGVIIAGHGLCWRRESLVSRRRRSSSLRTFPPRSAAR
jgi:hypothetical protein